MPRCGATFDGNRVAQTAVLWRSRFFVSEFDPKPQTSLKSRRSATRTLN